MYNVIQMCVTIILSGDQVEAGNNDEAATKIYVDHHMNTT